MNNEKNNEFKDDTSREHKLRDHFERERKENTLWCWTCILKGKVWLRANVKNNKRMAKLRCEHKEAKNFLERANYDRERICCVGALNEKRLLCDKTCVTSVVVVVVDVGVVVIIVVCRFRRCLFNINSIKVNVLLIN